MCLLQNGQLFSVSEHSLCFVFFAKQISETSAVLLLSCRRALLLSKAFACPGLFVLSNFFDSSLRGENIVNSFLQRLLLCGRGGVVAAVT
jgi:hypothetical protein